MARINDILEKLSDNAATIVDLPGFREENIRCKALLIKREPPQFELVFAPRAWDAADLKIGADSQLAVEHNGHTLNLIARLDGVVRDRRLRFTAKEPVLPEDLRDYFRVSISTPIEASYVAGLKEMHTRTWKLTGTTIDMSGSGLLALFDEKPPSNHRIQLIITVPEEVTPIVCLASVVRTYRVRKNHYQVAFHFENVPTKTRDLIIASCMQEQRRQLRGNARII